MSVTITALVTKALSAEDIAETIRTCYGAEVTVHKEKIAQFVESERLAQEDCSGEQVDTDRERALAQSRVLYRSNRMINVKDIANIVFNQKDGNTRNMFVILNGYNSVDYEDLYKGAATYLSLGSSGDAENIMNVILNRHGGFLRIEGRDDDEWKVVDPVDSLGPHELLALRVDRAAKLATQAAVKSLSDDGVDVNEIALLASVKSFVIEFALTREVPAPEMVQELPSPR